jgi:hypothetical protein
MNVHEANLTTPRQEVKLAALWWTACLLAMALRLACACLGHNYDMASWFIVSDAVLQGENPYVTFRFNYAPSSAYLLGAIRWLQESVAPTPEVLMEGELLSASTALRYHLGVVLVLGTVDIIIAALLKAMDHVAGWIFLLHPAVILLTGYHSQVESLGVLFLLLSASALEKKSRFPWALVAMMLSLQMKHLAIFFPFWIAFRKDISKAKRLAFVLVPVIIFFLSFQPFMGNPLAREALDTLTFNHSSFHLSAFWPHLFDAFVPVVAIEKSGELLGFNHSFKGFFFGVVLLMGFALRALPMRVCAVVYCGVFTVFASGMADQYLSIAMVYMAYFWRSPLTWMFGGITTMLLCASHYNVGALPEMLTINRTVRGLGWMRWHGLGWLFCDLLWRLYEYKRGGGRCRDWMLPWRAWSKEGVR